MSDNYKQANSKDLPTHELQTFVVYELPADDNVYAPHYELAMATAAVHNDDANFDLMDIKPDANELDKQISCSDYKAHTVLQQKTSTLTAQQHIASAQCLIVLKEKEIAEVTATSSGRKAEYTETAAAYPTVVKEELAEIVSESPVVVKEEHLNEFTAEFLGREELTEFASECAAVVKQENFKEVADCLRREKDFAEQAIEFSAMVKEEGFNEVANEY